jgi:regulatory protein
MCSTAAMRRVSCRMNRANRSRDGQAGTPQPRKPRELTPLQRAIGLLSRREHSHRELVRKLAARGVEPEEAQAAVARLREDGWQDDARFAESLVRSRAGSGYGPVRIRAELATHGLDESMVASALAAFAGDWLENARDLVRRRIGACIDGDLSLQRRASELLYRRGFTADQVRMAVRGLDPDD